MKNFESEKLIKLTQEYLKKILRYDEATGIFTWLERPISMFQPGKSQIRSCKTWNTQNANKEAGSICTQKKGKTSYTTIRITLNEKAKNYKAHRLAILYTEGNFPPEAVDHKDGDGLNNRRDNLREVAHKENMKNMPMRSNNISGIVGVCWYKRYQKWQASIRVNGKNIHGGYFIDIEDAITKRKNMEIEYGFHKNHGRKS